MLDYVVCECGWCGVCVYFVVPNIQSLFSISIIKGNDEKCKWQARKNLVLSNYKRWRNQITLKWKRSQPFSLFSQFPSGLIICLISFFTLKLLLNWLKIAYSTAGASGFCFGMILLKRQWKELWSEFNLRVTVRCHSKLRAPFHKVTIVAWATPWGNEIVGANWS